MHQDSESDRILEKAFYIEKSLKAQNTQMLNEQFGYLNNPNTCLITLDGSLEHMGTILSMTQEI